MKISKVILLAMLLLVPLQSVQALNNKWILFASVFVGSSVKHRIEKRRDAKLNEIISDFEEELLDTDININVKDETKKIYLVLDEYLLQLKLGKITRLEVINKFTNTTELKELAAEKNIDFQILKIFSSALTKGLILDFESQPWLEGTISGFVTYILLKVFFVW